MDSNRRERGGFMKAKLRSLYRTSSSKVTPSATSTVNQGGYTTVLNRNTTSTPSVGKLIVNQEQVTHPQLSKHMAASVSLYLPSPEIAATACVSSYSATRTDTLYGGAVDDAVDLKAEDYISSVRKRFSLAY